MSLSTRLYAITEGVRIAIESIKGNRVRAGLTILGVAVGVFVVVVISAAIHGINTSVARDFEATGPTTFFVSRYPITFEACDGSGETCKWLRNPPITWSEIEALQRKLDEAGSIVELFHDFEAKKDRLNPELGPKFKLRVEEFLASIRGETV